MRQARSLRIKRRAIKSGSSIGIRKAGSGGGGGAPGTRRTIKKKNRNGEETEYEMGNVPILLGFLSPLLEEQLNVS